MERFGSTLSVRMSASDVGGGLVLNAGLLTVSWNDRRLPRRPLSAS
jgi:hypothetical protein